MFARQTGSGMADKLWGQTIFPIILTIVVLSAPNAWSANHYIRAGASGSGSGADWANAYSDLPASLIRGDVYYVADGTYAGRAFNTPVSGSLFITIKKATVADHGTATGWVDTMGGGQATFTGTFFFYTDNWTVTGSYRNESDWGDGAAYGFVVPELYSSDLQQAPFICADNINASYINLGGAEGNAYTGSEPTDVIYNLGSSDLCQNWHLDHLYLHNVAHATMIQFAGTSGTTVEYTMLKNGWGKEAIRGQGTAKNLIIRFNRFYNACGSTYVVGEGCTGEIAIWDGGANSFDNNQIYGNSFYRTRDEDSGGTIVVGGNGSSWVGPPANNTLVYNNTIAGIQANLGAGPNILINGGSGNIIRNTLWYDVIGTPTATANTTSNNVEVFSNPFVGYNTGDLRLSGPTAAGFALPAPYNADMLGNTRGSDGNWDLGAFEFVSGGTIANAAPIAPKGLTLR